MRLFTRIICLLTLGIIYISIGEAKVKIVDVKHRVSGNQATMIVKVDGPIETTPELLVKNSLVQISLEDAIVWPKIEKTVDLQNSQSSTISAYQFNKETVRVRSAFKYNIEGLENKVSVELQEKQILLHYPIVKTPARASSKSNIVKKSSKVNSKDTSKYDEKYLEQLLSQRKPIEKKENLKESVAVDQVSSKKSAPQKNGGFSVMNYVTKFVAFLGLMLIGLYGAVTLFRKGVIKKGKFNFLNNADHVSLLSTTHISPKKSLLLVKAHKQVFLVGSSETGLNLISEVSDPAGLFKEEERAVSNLNFDTSIEVATEKNVDQKIKEDISVSNTMAKNSETDKVRDKVKFSDQIKAKVKSLKPLQ